MRNKKNLLVDILEKKLKNLEIEAKPKETGRVLEVKDGTATIWGLEDLASQEMVRFENGQMGLAFNLEQDSTGVIILGPFEGIREGDRVTKTGKILQTPVGEELLGRVINPLGEPLDGKGPIRAEKALELERPAPSIIERQPVDSPLYTGIKAIDSMMPIGRGQRELIIGDRQTGKTQIVLDAILAQKDEPSKNRPACIYVAIGQKARKIAQIADILDKRGALEYTVIVAANASDPAPLLYLAPYTGCSLGEYFRDSGRDALVVYDDLSKHAWSYRQLSLLMRRPPGREAYPGDIFYLHSRLLERAARLSDGKGGGSLTALPIVETLAGDISGYIPTNVISITDGQIYLETDLFNKGIRPAINVGLSVSRVGSAAQESAMKEVAKGLRLDLAQFRELEAFSQFSGQLDKETQAKIKRGSALVELLKQPAYAPLLLEEQAVVIFAGTEGLCDDIEVRDIQSFEKFLRDYLRRHHSGILKAIKKTRSLKDVAKDLTKAVKNAKEVFLKKA